MITFENSGQDNTNRALELAVERGKELGVTDYIVASNNGDTALILADLLKDQEANINCVTHHVGFKEPGQDEMSQENREKLSNQGISVLTTTHLFANIERAVTNEFGGLYPGGIVSATLRCFGQGVKVTFEISTMALDAGLIPYGKKVIAIGGSGRGADSAVVITPAHGKDFFKTSLHEIICKPAL
ncbi:pyruvate kinase alpha/beta domain-containing protein [Natranaerobius thermophilus JW/NM-WN-LF]|uniref:Pyruvate kinase C-terminal domain-containing protein n=1 Tax=Natranaerobius thermophilus (strain ATCC BAA-1301 / DSM 18059 / JW/NM-WN-LF) TaxID=457570 RepID=B2A230_NATTJ|nr:pyruvate kinase alpha/beta domain-containing protein [Natranaerobius thermophilus]ACB84835.1 conserved hypothetical protein [Natranaerobius thermophilus JW/NM-WN-LF]